jgi:hypothetical protein
MARAIRAAALTTAPAQDLAAEARQALATIERWCGEEAELPDA